MTTQITSNKENQKQHGFDFKQLFAAVEYMDNSDFTASAWSDLEFCES